MATVYVQGWIEDDEGYIRHDGYRVYTTRGKAIEDTDRLELTLNGPSLGSAVCRDGPPFVQEVPDVVYERAKAREGFSVESLGKLQTGK